MPQLAFETFFTQSFWLIFIFLLTYLVIGNEFLPKLSFIIKYRSEFQNEKNQSLNLLSNEIQNLDEYLINTTHFKNIFQHFQTLIQNFLNLIQNFLQNHYKTFINSYLIHKYTILLELSFLNNDN